MPWPLLETTDSESTIQQESWLSAIERKGTEFMPEELLVTSLHLIGLDELKKRSGWFVALGVLLVILGMIALASSVVFTIASVLFEIGRASCRERV